MGKTSHVARWAEHSLLPLLVPQAAIVGPLRADDAKSDAVGDPLPNGAIRRLGSTRFRSDDFLTDLAWSPNGRLIASTAANFDRGVRLWDAATGKLLKTLRHPDDSNSGIGKALLSPLMAKGSFSAEPSTGSAC